jgi:tripartite-type tricarboxylate transporter receptor subunit TctC
MGRACALVLACGMWAVAAAAEFPEREVRIVVPFPPGGGTDALTRIVAKELTRIWNRQVIVDNRAGAQGNVGTTFAAKAPPDGYTIVLAHQGVMSINPHIYANAGFDPLKDFIPVVRATEQPFVLVVHPDVPVKSLQELTVLAKAQPGKLSFASSASGPQLAGERYKLAAGVNLLHVPYKGAGPAVVDLLAGHVNMMFSNPTSVNQHVKSGKLRALAVFAPKRNEALPDVPTAIESGFPQLAEMIEWYGYAVPAGTPAAMVTRLNADLTAALNAPEAQKSLRAQGFTPAPGTPEEFAAQIRRDHERWGAAARAAGVKAD